MLSNVPIVNATVIIIAVDFNVSFMPNSLIKTI